MSESLLSRAHNTLSPETRKKITFFIVAAFAIGIGCSTIYRAEFDKKIRTDVSVYRAAGVGVLEGKDLYTVENERTWFYTSPPIVAVLCVPLAYAPLVWDALAVYLLSLVLLGAVARMSYALMNSAAGEARLQSRTGEIIAIGFLFNSLFFADVLTRGQFGILVLACLMGALLASERKQPAWAGLLLGFAISIKVTPALLLPIYFLIKREFKIVLWTGAAGLFFSILIPAGVFGFKETLHYLWAWAEKVPLSAYHIPTNMNDFYGDPFKFWRQIHDPFIYRNQSLYAVLARIVYPDSDTMVAHGISAIKIITTSVTILMIAASLDTLRRPHRAPYLKILEYSLLITVLLINSTLTWTHYFASLYPAFLGLWWGSFAHPDTRKGRVLKNAALWSVGLIWIGYALKPLLRIGFPLWGEMVIWATTVWILRDKKEITNG